MSGPGTVATFYSYKGGTGRTMALANTATALARQGLGDVLMVDWDLEAPGLVDFFPELASADGALEQGGVLELFEVAESLVPQSLPLAKAEEAMRVWELISIEDHIAETAQEGLHLMPAGILDESYGARVNALPWRSLFDRCPGIFRKFAEELAKRYRYVLIDSRTGLADSSGICTTLMPDLLVTVFTPNQQSLAGVIDLVRRATTYRGRSRDLRPLLVYPLASRVEMSEDELRQEWRYGRRSVRGYQPAFEQLFQEVYDLPHCDLERYFDEVQIQHSTSYAYGERVAVRDDRSDRLSLARSYERFTRTLVEEDPPWAFGSQTPSERSEGDPAPLLAKLNERRHQHEATAQRARILDFAFAALAVAALAGALAVTFSFSSGESFNRSGATGLTVVLFVTAALLELVRRKLAFGVRGAIHAHLGRRLEREQMLFEAKGGIYHGAEAPVALLAQRIDEIEEEADESLFPYRSSLRLPTPGRPPRD